MAYTPINWKDSPSTDTAIDKTNLNRMDTQIAQNASDINGFQTQINTINAANTRISSDITKLNAAIGTLKFVTCSRAAYNALATKDANTLYIFTS